MKDRKWLVAGLLLALSVPAGAAEDASCQTISFAEIGWTDTTVITSIARFLLERLDYQSQVERLSVPDTFVQLASGELDVLMGNWMPSQKAELDQYRASVDIVRANLEGARYTLAVPRYTYEAGVKTVTDLAARQAEFGGVILGVKSSSGTARIARMVADNAYGLGHFTLEEKSEAMMLATVKNQMLLKKPVVFLAWEPHPMNTALDFEYLGGADRYFGANFGSSTVYTVANASLRRRCPNVGRLLENLEFTVAMENELMDQVLNQNVNPRRAARAWLKSHPKVVEGWLQGVTTRTGAPGLPVVESDLKR
ncbi:MAG: glycine/betaine ABC transporter substrate-binding protein [Pseudomonas oryzihabitans]